MAIKQPSLLHNLTRPSATNAVGLLGLEGPAISEDGCPCSFLVLHPPEVYRNYKLFLCWCCAAGSWMVVGATLSVGPMWVPRKRYTYMVMGAATSGVGGSGRDLKLLGRSDPISRSRWYWEVSDSCVPGRHYNRANRDSAGNESYKVENNSAHLDEGI
ncbi:hypothetical protein DFP72DRAFT_851877 [Ephemerocybe angulata]|uniref:Uncharacterized protein n=1 Tax=Ephemerocybe angulata TaxID=980116 RepID=A0A8H6M2U2_9AGAR|nr:hypothetical protein DFP72DRAFT_851877 [Tulosesus angulatus]